MTKTEANYLTASGCRITVESHTDFDGDYETYTWRCPGCGTEKPLTADGLKAACDTARAHAETCHALPKEA